MRPLTLTMAGLRSYRAQRTLDFTDATLMAILGDTGAGKSSILEGIYAALYGRCTWEGRGLNALISDGIRTLQVELTFACRGKMWRVSRSVSRGSYPPSKHVLKCLDDGEHIEGDTQVTNRIVQVVGLTANEFQRAVILPQNKFSQLLNATEGERTELLRGIFGLSALETVHRVADRAHDALRDALTPALTSRARLFPDPQAVADLAAVQLVGAKAKRDALVQASARVEKISTTTSAVAKAIPSMERAHEAVRKVDLGKTLTDLTAADSAAESYAKEAVALGVRRQEAERIRTAAQQQLDDLAKAGLTTESLARATSTLEQLVQDLPLLQEEAALLRETAAALSVEAGEVEALDVAAQSAKAAAESARAGTADLRAWAAERAEAAAEARRQLSAMADAQASVRELLDRASHSTEIVILAQTQSDAACRIEAERIAQVEKLTDELDALRTANAAAHVAAGHVEGEPCPVCRRTLPTGFVAPEIIGDQALSERLAEARRAVESARKDTAAAQKRAAVAHAGAEAAIADLDAAVETLHRLARVAGLPVDESPTATLPNLDEVLGELPAVAQPGVADPSSMLPSSLNHALSRIMSARTDPVATALAVDLAKTTQRDELLHSVDQEARLANEQLGIAETHLQDLLDEATRSNTLAEAARRELERRQSEHAQRQTGLRARARQLLNRSAGLPDLVAQPLSLALGVSGWDDAEALLAARTTPTIDIARLSAVVAERGEAIGALAEKIRLAQDELEAVGSAEAALLRRRHNEVETPRSKARAALAGGSGAISTLMAVSPALLSAWDALVGAAAVPALPQVAAALTLPLNGDCADDSLTSVCAAAVAQLNELAENVDGLLLAAQAGLGTAQEAVVDLLSGVDLASVAELDIEAGRARAVVEQLEARRQRALAQLRLAADLDEGIAAVETEIAVLRALKDTLARSAFPAMVVKVRQQSLLAVASTLLGQLTRGAYGFSEDFRIIDRRTAQARAVKTLSGGETFLASLALALGLVEISNRGGGQLDALFLDEGFGSLDSAVLAESLDVLREHAAAGRLVAVISHLHAVAADLDQVLLVRKEAGGSDFHWLDAGERDRFLLDDVGAGLVG